MDESDSVVCTTCPNAKLASRQMYAEHVKTAWHLHNVHCRMMGNESLSEAAYAEKFELASQTQKQADASQQEVLKQCSLATSTSSATVAIIFQYRDQKWTHKFDIDKGSTLWDLKKLMLKPDCPQEDLVSFHLKKGMIRVWNFDIIDSDETFEFDFCGPEEGQEFFSKDTQRKARDDAARLREEAEREEAALRKARQEEAVKATGASVAEATLGENLKTDFIEGKREAHDTPIIEQLTSSEEKVCNPQGADSASASCQGSSNERATSVSTNQLPNSKDEEDLVKVVVHADIELELDYIFRVKPGTTVAELKELIAEEMSTAQMKAQNISLADAYFGQTISNSEIITGNIEYDLDAG